jgi:hypothetical protein
MKAKMLDHRKKKCLAKKKFESQCFSGMVLTDSKGRISGFHGKKCLDFS